MCPLTSQGNSITLLSQNVNQLLWYDLSHMFPLFPIIKMCHELWRLTSYYDNVVFVINSQFPALFCCRLCGLTSQGTFTITMCHELPRLLHYHDVIRVMTPLGYLIVTVSWNLKVTPLSWCHKQCVMNSEGYVIMMSAMPWTLKVMPLSRWHLCHELWHVIRNVSWTLKFMSLSWYHLCHELWHVISNNYIMNSEGYAIIMRSSMPWTLTVTPLWCRLCHKSPRLDSVAYLSSVSWTWKVIPLL